MSNPWYGYVHFAGLSPETRLAFEEWIAKHDLFGDFVGSYMKLEQFAELYFRLKFHCDDQDLFPKGKWATLQKMEDLIEEGLKP